jgi:hypothetical protein
MRQPFAGEAVSANLLPEPAQMPDSIGVWIEHSRYDVKKPEKQMLST